MTAPSALPVADALTGTEAIPGDQAGETVQLTPNAIIALAAGLFGVTMQDEGSPLATKGTTINVTGGGATVSGTGAVKTLNIPGGGAGASDAVDVAFDPGGTDLVSTDLQALGEELNVKKVDAADALAVTGTPTVGQVVTYAGGGLSEWADAAGGAGGGSIVGSPISEVVITAAVTLDSDAFGQMHVCSGTTVDYTVGLPPVAGNDGKVVGIRMAPGLTRLVTIDGNAAELVGGLPSRIMWAGESAILLVAGGAWVKIAGLSRPMDAAIRNINDSQIIPTGFAGFTTILMGQTDVDTTGFMADLGNERIVIKRPGTYVADGLVYYVASAAATRMLARIANNGAAISERETEVTSPAAYPQIPLLARVNLAAGDLINLGTMHNSGGDRTVFGSPTTGACTLAVSEVLSW